MTLFGPRITIYTKDGRSYSKQGTGREFIWDFEEEARKLSDIVPGIPVTSARFQEIRAIGDELQAALLALLFETPDLERLVRDYLIF